MKEPGGILGQASEADEDVAHDILERLEDVTYSITPKRVVFASIMAVSYTHLTLPTTPYV